MRYLQHILYGLIIGHWLIGVKGRLCTGKVQGRYAVVGLHAHREEYVLVGHSGDKRRAMEATDFVEDNAAYYIGLCYDLLDPGDRAEFDSKLFCPYIEDEDMGAIETARGML